MSVQSNQTNVMRLMLTVAILLVAMSVSVMLDSPEMVVTAVTFVCDNDITVHCNHKLQNVLMEMYYYTMAVLHQLTSQREQF